MSELITMQQPSPGVLVTPGGVPVVPGWLQDKVSGLTDGRARVEWIAGAHRPYFGLKVRWRSGDPRWEHVRTGQMPAAMAFDLEKMFPGDCSPNDMAAYVESLWGERVVPQNLAAEAERIVTESVVQQAKAKADHVDRLVETGTERHLSESPHLRRVRAGAEAAHPMVSGGLER